VWNQYLEITFTRVGTKREIRALIKNQFKKKKKNLYGNINFAFQKKELIFLLTERKHRFAFLIFL
jgi:hypothetical protein